MDCLQEWPEPIVRVQSLSESGITSIPERYVKRPSERPTLSGFEDRSARGADIPTIDLGGLMGSAVECRATLRSVSDACREWGFFQVVNHGVSLDLMRRVVEVWREFFNLPMEEKQKYANTPKTYEGYGSRLGVVKGAILDWGDYYFLHVFPHCMRDLRKWPSIPTSCRDLIDEYSREVMKLCTILMKALSMGLGLEAEQLLEAIGGGDTGGGLRVNFYSKCPQPDLTLGLSAHSDPGALTVVLADERVKGLQVRKAGEWVTVQPVPGSFIVNVGDQVQVLSNAIYKSVEHRVLVNSEKERISIAFFYNPKGDLPVGPVDALTSPEQPGLYSPMTFDEYRLFVRMKGPKGKEQVESLKSAAV